MEAHDHMSTKVPRINKGENFEPAREQEEKITEIERKGRKKGTGVYIM